MWKITKDISGAGDLGLPNRKGWTSCDYDGRPLLYKFRMCCDDGEVMYYGYSSSNDDEEAFAPLDDLGEPDAGCTYIEYYNNGWEML